MHGRGSFIYLGVQGGAFFGTSSVLLVSKLFIFCASGYRNEIIQKVLLFQCKLAFYTWKQPFCLSVCQSVCPFMSRNFLKIGLLVFSDIVHDDS